MTPCDVVYWDEAAQIHVRWNVGDEGNSGRVVLNLSFVEADPEQTWRACTLTFDQAALLRENARGWVSPPS